MEIEQEIYEKEQKKAINYKNGFSENEELWITGDEEDLKVGDIIYINYSSDSQKYMYTHTPECGEIQEIYYEKYISPIDESITDELNIKILNHNNELINLNKERLSIYSKGYFMFIQKLNK
jgi:hypothetical protein